MNCHRHPIVTNQRMTLSIKRLLMTILSVFMCIGLYAAADKCPAPVIETSTGNQEVCPGVSTITISAPEGTLISYTTDQSDPSIELSDALQGPLTFTVEDSFYEIRAVALSDGKEPSDCVTMDLSPIAYRYDNFSKMYLNSAIGYLPGPYLIYAIKPLKDSSGYWIILCEPSISQNSDCMIAECLYNPLSTFPDVRVGETIDYINIVSYDNRNTPKQGGMKRITSFSIPEKSVPFAGSIPQLLTIDGSDGVDTDLLDYLRVPIILGNVNIEGDKIYNNEGQEFEDIIIDGKFADIDLDFPENTPYNIRGFVGTDVSDNHYPLHFFVLGYEKANDVVAGLTDAMDCDDIIMTADGRPVLSRSQKMYDITGRRADSATAGPGIYLIYSPSRTSKIVIR